MYCDDFEAAFLERTADFSAREAAETRARSNAPAYLAHAELRLGEELDRVGAYLDASSQAKLIKAGVGGWGAGGGVQGVHWGCTGGAGCVWWSGAAAAVCCGEAVMHA